MKMIAFFLLVTFMQVSANGYSQRITISQNNIPIKKLFKEIEQRTGYQFFYKEKLFKQTPKTSVNIVNGTVEQILDQCFRGQRLTYSIVDKVVVITEKEQRAEKQETLISIAPAAIVVKGQVTDESGKPLYGVSVMVKGSEKGVRTNADGGFSIEANKGDELEFTFVGYKPQRVTVTDNAPVMVKLVLEIASGSEVIVVGYGTQKKANTTSAITSVNTAELNDRSLTKLGAALQGIAAGVNIRQQTGRPGFNASTFDIRGASMGTFSSNPPLVIIDGIVDDINNINPNDVDKISILKDAAAAAIYGSRATGGVVLVTTKKGVSGRTRINYSTILGVQQAPFAKYRFLNTADWMRANNEAAKNDDPKNPDIYTADQIAKYENSMDPQFPSTSQWADWIPKSAFQQNHNINVAGGTDKLNLYASVGYTGQDGFIPNDDYKRLSLLLNTNYKPSSKLTIGTNFTFLKEDVTRPATGIGAVNDILRNSLMTPPTTPFYLPNGDYNNATLWGNNPANVVEYGGNDLGRYYKFRMGLNVSYELIKDLMIQYGISTRIGFFTDNNINNRIPYRNNDGAIYGYSRDQTTVSEAWTKDIYLSNQLTLEYKKVVKDHSFGVLAGVTAEDGRVDNIGASARGFATNLIREISATTGTGADITGTSDASDWALASVISRLNYSFKGKYLLEAASRYDGSSRFSPRQRWGFFPSVSAGWRISSERFMQDISLINDLKIRGSWGELGNQGSTLYPFAQTVNNSSTLAMGNGLVSTATLGEPVDLSLTWEKKRTVNLGLEFSMLSNRLSGSFDYFFDKTRDIIGRPVVSSVYGAAAPIRNTFVIANRGYEFVLNWRSSVGALRYNIGVNLSDTRDKVLSLGGIGTTNPLFSDGVGLVQLSSDSYLHEGESRNHFYLYRSDGLFVNQKEIDSHAFISSLTRPGDIVFVDANGDGKLTPDDKRPDKRTSTPHYVYGFNMSLEYKNFDLGIIINGVGERWGYRNTGGVYLTGVRPSLAMWQENYDNRWSTTNPDKWADQPRLTNNNWISGEYSTLFSGPVEYHLRNFKYLRVKSLQIGYTLSPNVINRIGLSKARLFITGENVLTIKPGYKEEMDPESVMTYTPEGSAFFGVPRVLSFGVNVTFK